MTPGGPCSPEALPGPPGSWKVPEGRGGRRINTHRRENEARWAGEPVPARVGFFLKCGVSLAPYYEPKHYFIWVNSLNKLDDWPKP